MFHWGKKEAVNSERIKTLSQGLKEYFEQNYTGSTEADLSAWRPPEYTYHGAADATSQNDIPEPGAVLPGSQITGVFRKRKERPKENNAAKAPTAPRPVGYSAGHSRPTKPSKPSKSDSVRVDQFDDLMYRPSRPEPTMSAPDMAEPPLQASKEPSFSYHRRLEDILKEADETFVERLFRYADERKLTDSQLYRKSHIDKRHFGKIKNGEIKPVKDVVIAFILGLELNLDEAEDLLRSAGFTLSTSIKFDLAIKYFIKNGIYNTIEINEVLEDQKLPTLRYY